MYPFLFMYVSQTNMSTYIYSFEFPDTTTWIQLTQMLLVMIQMNQTVQMEISFVE